MPEITIYTTTQCPFCAQAKHLLTRRGLAYTEVLIDGRDDAARQELVERTGGMTFPQIIIDGETIGGFDALRARCAAGLLPAAEDQ